LLRVVADMPLSESNHHRLTQLNLAAQTNAETLMAPAINEDNKGH